MKWYYAEGGKQIGPVEESVLEDLVRQGTVRDETLVWREGMASWQRYAAVRGGSGPAPAAPPPPPPVTASPAVSANTAQRLQEGGSARRFGGFWIRFLARLIDGVLLGIALCVIIVPLVLVTGGFGAVMERSGGLEATAGGVSILPILGIIVVAILGPALYEVYFVSTRAATPGKLALGLKIIRADGTPITTGLAVGRYFAYLLSSLIPLAIGFIMAGFDREKRSLHDHICATRVIYSR